MTAERSTSKHELDSEQILHNVEVRAAAGITEAQAYSCNIFAQISLPHRGGKNEVEKLTRRNGNLTVVMSSAGSLGLPYGYYARLILCWLVRQACIRNAQYDIDEARRIPLNGSIREIMLDMGISQPKRYASKKINEKTGKKETYRAPIDSRRYKQFADQLRRIRGMSITVEIDGKLDSIEFEDQEITPLTEKSFLCWDTKDGEVKGDSYILLSEPFFKQAVEHAVPLDPAHLAQFGRSPLAFDLYVWAAYRLFTNKGYTYITWQQLRDQIGAGYPDTPQGMRNFKKKVLIALDKIKTAWPQAKISEWYSQSTGGLRLEGNATPVDRRSQEDSKDSPNDSDNWSSSSEPKF